MVYTILAHATSYVSVTYIVFIQIFSLQYFHMKLFLGDREGLNLRGVPLRISFKFSWGSQIAIFSAKK